MEAEFKIRRSNQRFDIVELDGGKCAISIRRGETVIALLIPRDASCEATEALAAKLEQDIRTIVPR